MTRYSFQPRDLLFVKGYGFLSFAKYMSKKNGKNISTNLNGKYSQKPLDHAKQPATDALKTSSKSVMQKTAEATDDLVGIEIANRITKSQKVHYRLIQEQLQMNMLKKYQKKDIHLQKKYQKLLMI